LPLLSYSLPLSSSTPKLTLTLGRVHHRSPPVVLRLPGLPSLGPDLCVPEVWGHLPPPVAAFSINISPLLATRSDGVVLSPVPVLLSAHSSAAGPPLPSLRHRLPVAAESSGDSSYASLRWGPHVSLLLRALVVTSQRLWAGLPSCRPSLVAHRHRGIWRLWAPSRPRLRVSLVALPTIASASGCHRRRGGPL
jgi:hypothetical protein